MPVPTFNDDPKCKFFGVHQIGYDRHGNKAYEHYFKRCKMNGEKKTFLITKAQYDEHIESAGYKGDPMFFSRVEYRPGQSEKHEFYARGKKGKYEKIPSTRFFSPDELETPESYQDFLNTAHKASIGYFPNFGMPTPPSPFMVRPATIQAVVQPPEPVNASVTLHHVPAGTDLDALCDRFNKEWVTSINSNAELKDDGGENGQFMNANAADARYFSQADEIARITGANPEKVAMDFAQKADVASVAQKEQFDLVMTNSAKDVYESNVIMAKSLENILAPFIRTWRCDRTKEEGNRPFPNFWAFKGSDGDLEANTTEFKAEIDAKAKTEDDKQEIKKLLLDQANGIFGTNGTAWNPSFYYTGDNLSGIVFYKSDGSSLVDKCPRIRIRDITNIQSVSTVTEVTKRADSLTKHMETYKKLVSAINTAMTP